MKRSKFSSATDYTGCSFSDILIHIKDWKDSTKRTIGQLRQHRATVESKASEIKKPWAVIEFIDYRIDLFTKVFADLERLSNELSQGVTLGHIETIQQLVKRTQFDDHTCVRFKNEFVEEQPNQPILGKVYADSRDMIMDYLDLANVAHRLRTFVGIKKPSAWSAVLLQLNFWGIGIDLKQIYRNVKEFWVRKVGKGS